MPRTHVQQNPSPPPAQSGALDTSIELWLRGRRPATIRVYRSTLASLRAELRLVEMDLTSNPRHVAYVAAYWLGCRADGRAASLATKAQRLAIVASFYRFARRTGQFALDAGDPVPLIITRLAAAERADDDDGEVSDDEEGSSAQG